MKSIKTAIAMSTIAGAASWSGASFAVNDNNDAAHNLAFFHRCHRLIDPGRESIQL